MTKLTEFLRTAFFQWSMTRDEAYIEGATNLAELEQRLRALERSA